MKKMMIFATLLVAFWGFQSCEDPNSVGSSVIPSDGAVEVDSLSFKDFVVNILRDDSLYTGFRANLYLGNTNKPNLGNATSAIYTEFSLNDTLPTGMNVLDSAVLYLNPVQYSGEENLVQNFDVYTIQDSIPSETNILIDYSIPTEQKIATITAKYSTDSISVNNTKHPFHLRGTIEQAFAENLFNNLANVKTTQALQKELKGLKITGDSQGNGLYSINPLSTASSISGIQMYYKNASNEAKKLSLRMSPFYDTSTDSTFNAGVYNFNEMNGNYNTTIMNQLDNYSQNGYNLSAVDTSNGIISQVQFPNISSEFVGTETINSAELKINVDYTSNLKDTLSLPNALFLAEEFKTDADGKKTGELIGIDGSGLTIVESDKRYDRTAVGFRQRIEQGIYTYTFYLPNYMERVKDGVEPTLLYIATSNRGENLNGFSFDSSTDLELNIKYSKTN